MSLRRIFTRGIWRENPIFRLLLGLCPALAVTTSVENGLGMGLASTFVLFCSNTIISIFRGFIPKKVRIPAFIVVIASFVTIVDLVMHGFFYELHKNLGLFIPLIVVNCIILGRAEAFASKNRLTLSIVDGFGMGLGFTLALAILGACREVLGNGTLTIWRQVGWQIPDAEPLILMILAPGGFIALGCLLGLMNHIQAAAARRRGQVFTPPQHLDCRHCTLCKPVD